MQTMLSNRDVVILLADCLHICMVNAIDTALTATNGDNWFKNFKEFDANQTPILENGSTSVYSMDLQACLKFFLFREDYAKIVYEYYGHNFFDRSKEAFVAEKQLKSLLFSLKNNMRNNIYAHATPDTVQGANSNGVYGTKEAINDMLRFAALFKTVTDADGVSYYSKMQQIAQQATQCDNSYYVDEVIAKEQMRVSVGTFVDACNALKIKIISDNDGRIRFITANYDGDIARITLQLSSTQPKKTSPVLLTVLIAVGVILIGAVVFLAVGLHDGGDGETAKPSVPTKSHTVDQMTEAELPIGTSTTETTPTTLPRRHISGESRAEGLILSVDQVQSDGAVTVYYENTSEHLIGYGFAGTRVTCILQTASGKKYAYQVPNSYPDQISPYSSGTFSAHFPELDEDITNITCKGFRLLDDRGLPIKTIDIDIAITTTVQ